MRLIGRPELLKLARAAGGRPCDAVYALAAELEAAFWQSADDVRKAFPTAHLSGDRLTVDLDSDHCVVVAISYEKGVALVKFAGSNAELPGSRVAKSGRRT